MALDRIYRLFPAGGTTGGVAVWGSPVESGLAAVGAPIERSGISYNPSSSVVVRLRWRSDIVPGTSVIRDAEDRIWFVSEFREVDRRRWLDVALSTYDLPTDDAGTGGLPGILNPPAGWFLQYREPGGPNKFAYSGRYVERIIVTQSEIGVDDGFFENGMRKFAITIPSPGYAVNVEDPRRPNAPALLENWMEQTLRLGAFGTINGGWIPATSPDDENIEGFYQIPDGGSGQTIVGTTLDSGALLPGGGAVPFFVSAGGNLPITVGTRIDITPAG